MEADNLTYILFFVGCGLTFLVPEGDELKKKHEEIMHEMSSEFRGSFLSNYTYLRNEALLMCIENCYATTFDSTGDITY